MLPPCSPGPGGGIDMAQHRSEDKEPESSLQFTMTDAQQPKAARGSYEMLTLNAELTG